MQTAELQKLLEGVRTGSVTPDAALERLRDFPTRDLGFARLDTHRELRRGHPESVLCAGKTPEQTALIFQALCSRNDAPESRGAVLGTKASQAHFEAVRSILEGKGTPLRFVSEAGLIVAGTAPAPESKRYAAVVSAGTSDWPAVEEAAVTLEMMGKRVRRVMDAGVAGLHRILSELETLRGAAVVVVVAGMDGALPSVVSGLVAGPVIAVPTSTGYGASFGGISALLAMLNSCSPGVTVVNIDNGFGAGYAAALILEAAEKGRES